MEKKHIPGRLQISTECNHECVFCSIPEGPVDKPDFDEIKRRITELKSLGTNDLFITGGEPTMHPRFLEVVDFAYLTGFDEITIQTNATNLSKPLLQSLKKYDNVKFNFSFHSFEEMVCDRLSAKKHYQRILEGIKNMCEMGFGGYPTIVITTLNYRKLKEHIIFIRKNFPSIKHFSFNFVDPSGRARQNKWVVPTLWESERYIHETARYLMDKGLTFRLERVPLCYMQGFEEFSTEIRMHAKEEKRLTYFAKEIPGKKNMTIEYSKQGEYIKTDACKACFLKDLCPGINPNYADVHGISEVFPVFTNPNTIIDRMKKSPSYGGNAKRQPPEG